MSIYLKCKECSLMYTCPCGWSNGNAACLTLQQPKEVSLTNNVFRERLNEAIEKKNLTYREVAEKAEISDIRMIRYIRGESEPRYQHVLSLAEVLDVTPEYLMGGNP